MLLCQDPSGSCVVNGCCSQGGDCFVTERIAFNRAKAVLQRYIATEENADVRMWLQFALGAMTAAKETGP